MNMHDVAEMWHSVKGRTITIEVARKPATVVHEQQNVEIVAQRGWRLKVQLIESDVVEAILYSLNGTRWEGPMLRADLVPTTANANGIYAVMSSSPHRVSYRESHVIGEVALSGTVIEGEMGYRGEQATVRSLILHHGHHQLPDDVRVLDVVWALEARYHCDVTVKQQAPRCDPYVFPTIGGGRPLYQTIPGLATAFGNAVR